MSKKDALKRIDAQPQAISGVMTATSINVRNLSVLAPYQGDFQVTSEGRIIVGASTTSGARGILSPYGMWGYNNSGIRVFNVWFAPDGSGHTAGDVVLGVEGNNWLEWDQSAGQLGLYNPQGAGFVAQNDGSLFAGDADGGHMRWDAGTQSFQIRHGTDIKAEIDSDGNATFDGEINASSGRIYGDFQVDAMLRAGDVDGPGVYFGKEQIDVDTWIGSIIVTDTENMPWMRVRAGGDDPGFFHVGRTGDYGGRMTFEIVDGTTGRLFVDGEIVVQDGSQINGEISITETGRLIAADDDVYIDLDGIKLRGTDDVPAYSNSVSWLAYTADLQRDQFTADELVARVAAVDKSSVYTLQMSAFGREADYDATVSLAAEGGLAKTGTITLTAVGNDGVNNPAIINMDSDGTDGTVKITGDFTLVEHSADPPNPAEGNMVLWMGDGGGTGDDGDVLMKVTAAAATTTYNLTDLLTAPAFKSYNVTTQGLGFGADVFASGYYEAPAADANLTQASTTQTYGSANISYAAHAFAVAGGAGSVDAGVVGLRVTGTSINNSGTRTTSDSETLSADITALSANEYVETSKKWLGQVTFELYTVSGTPATYSLDINYGFCKYEDWGNRDFTVTDFECVGYAGASDSNINIELLHHKATGWTYHATAFVPGATALVQLTTDHSTDDQISSGEHFAFKRAGLSQAIDGGDSEGVLVRVSTSANNALEFLNIHIGVTL